MYCVANLIDPIVAGKSGRAGMAIILFYGLALYALCGIVTGVAFVTVGVAQVLPHASVTAAGADSLAAGRGDLVALCARCAGCKPGRRKTQAMRRAHRSTHRMLWPVLALVVAVGFALALMLRAPPPVWKRRTR